MLSICHGGEEPPPLTPAEEAELASQVGLAYARVPISLSTCRLTTVDRFRRELSRLAGPVLVYCGRGGRAGGLVIMHLAAGQRMSGEQALARARELGVDLRDERLVELVRRYADAWRLVRV